MTPMVQDNAAMEPRIQYAQTADGVSIAYWTLGEGAPLVLASGWGRRPEQEWKHPDSGSSPVSGHGS